MARIRTIKPEFFRHRRLFNAEKETGLPLRIAFAGLWTVADREGRFKWEPDEIKLDCLPYDDVDFSRVLHALATRGFLVKYQADDREFGLIPGFLDHQVVNNRESKSSLPSPPKNLAKTMVDLTRQARVDDASSTRHELAQGEGKGREEERKESPPTPSSTDVPTVPVVIEGEMGRSITEVRKIVWRLSGKSEDEIGTLLIRTSQEGVPQARQWLQAGHSVEDIRDAVSRAYDTSAEPIRKPWVYLDEVMRNLGQKRDAVPDPQAHSDPMIDQWRVRLSRFREARKWFPSVYGPPPGPGCLAPDFLLEEFGYER